MTILAKTLLTLVRRHLMTLVLLSVWHNCNTIYRLNVCIVALGSSPLSNRLMFADPSVYYPRYVVGTLLNLACEALRWLESWDVVLRDGDSSILRDITSDLHSALLDDEAAEATKIYVLTINHCVLNALHESLYDSLNLNLLNAG